MKQTSEAAIKTAIEAALLAGGYHRLPSTAFDRQRAIFPEPPRLFRRLPCLSQPALADSSCWR